MQSVDMLRSLQRFRHAWRSRDGVGGAGRLAGAATEGGIASGAAAAGGGSAGGTTLPGGVSFGTTTLSLGAATGAAGTGAGVGGGTLALAHAESAVHTKMKALGRFRRIVRLV
jgi:hypothetical protein